METPMKLYVLEVDSLGRPDPKRILLDGPDIVVPGGDGIHPIQCTWVLNPPFTLPRPGQFAFQVKEDLCGGGFALLASTLDPYPGGGAWYTDEGIRCAGAGCCPDNHPWLGTMDLIFRIEICGQPVPDLPATWGQLKAKYH
jgi:hypothetical protein